MPNNPAIERLQTELSLVDAAIKSGDVSALIKLRGELAGHLETAKTEDVIVIREWGVVKLREFLEILTGLTGALEIVHQLMQQNAPTTRDDWERSRLKLVNEIGRVLSNFETMRWATDQVLNHQENK